jgi:hypothetical protein
MWMSAAQQLEPGSPPEIAPAMVKLLAHRYGDGFVYLRDREERELYEQAKTLGLISREGYLTPIGRSVMTAHDQ